MSFLYEKSGVIEFDNFEYRKNIKNIVDDIRQVSKNDLAIEIPYFEDIKFNKLTYTNIGLSWLDVLNVYVSFSEEFNAGALTDEYAKQNNIFVIDDGHIKIATIFVIDNGKENILTILFHEIAHLYDETKNKQMWWNDEIYFLTHQGYDVNSFGLHTDVNTISFDQLFNIVIESMYYANFSESHAFMENINFEIYETLNKHNRAFYSNDIDYVFIKSCKCLYNYHILDKLVEDMMKMDNDRKYAFYKMFQEEFSKAYYNMKNMNMLLDYLHKKIHKVISHSRTLFDFYYNLDSVAFRQFSLNEDMKKSLIKSYYISDRRIDE